MKTVCEIDKCTGCMACVDICSKTAIRIVDTLSEYNAVIDETKCVNCNRCYNLCQVNNPVKLFPVIKWYQGWTCDEKVRANSSSGGAAFALAKIFIQQYGVVCGCVFENGNFGFYTTEDVTELEKFTGSKYVKSNPSGIYQKVKNDLVLGKKVLFIGLPCQVAALKKYVGMEYEENLYTIDLICHGTPSPKILEQYLEEKGYNIREIRNLQFRKGMKFQLYVENESIVDDCISDSYLMIFLNALCYTKNCYHCNYAQRNRISDITLGDSWGSLLSEEEKNKGISLLLCQSKKGIQLVEQSDLLLKNVNLEKAIDANKQLKTPSAKSYKQEVFFSELKKGKNIDRVMRKCFPKEYYKNVVKSIFLKMRI